MANQHSVRYDEDEKTLRIRDLVIDDPDVAGFFQNRATEDDVRRALRVGVLAVEMAETSRDVDYVEQAVSELSNEFQNHVNEFIKEVEEQLEENSALIEDGLNPRADGTPTKQLKEDLGEKIETVLSTINEERGREEVYQLTTHKGDDFEEQLGKIIDELAVGPFDGVEHTAGSEGVLEDCETGDFVITTEEGYRIVIEAKNWTSDLTKNTIKSELDEAIRNRQADAGLLVSRNASAAPQTHIGTFHEFGPKRLYVALSQNPDDDLYPGFFKFAYNWARVRAHQAQAELASDIDEVWVNEQLKRLKEDIDELQSMRDQAKNIQKTAAELESDLNEKEAELLNTLADIKKEIATS